MSARKSSPTKASYLAHDTRNWLTVLQMYCDLLRTPGAVASGHKNWIDELSGAVERGQGLVVSLLDSVQEADRGGEWAVADGSAAADESAPAPTILGGLDVADGLDVIDGLRRRMDLLERMAGGKIRIELKANIGMGGLGGVGRVALDESAFERILYNLAGNAIEAMPQGGRLRLSVRIRRGDAGDTVRIRVLDTGIGIPPERLQKIFDAGVSGKEQQNGQGARGVGLAIVRELTEGAGGRVRVRSRPGRGSCFELEFPRSVSPDSSCRPPVPMEEL